jgi:putative methyltransferase (TIGR04325 family)
VNLKSAIRPFIPPIIEGVARRISARWFSGPSTPFSYSPRNSFAEAAREAGVGYEHQDLLSKFVDGRAPLDQLSDFAGAFLASIAMAAGAADHKIIRVLDYGGGSGYFRNYVDTFFDRRIRTDWWIVETPRQVELNSVLPLSDVCYSTKIGDRPYDIALFSGSLQYVEDWRAPLQEADADLIFIARTPLGDAERPYLQRAFYEGKPVAYPGRVISRQDLLGILNRTHEMVASWKFKAQLLQMGEHEAPAMLWRRRRL